MLLLPLHGIEYNKGYLLSVSQTNHCMIPLSQEHCDLHEMYALLSQDAIVKTKEQTQYGRWSREYSALAGKVTTAVLAPIYIATTARAAKST